ncbi:hypothetical protein TNCV_1398871 [Trichonephila clavipes]|nr:hypothetical protein TNCV_1398871 [Trichonephila clavipes]
MASNTDLPTDVDFQNATLPKSGNSTPKRLGGPTLCSKLKETKADIRRYTLIVQGFENMISLRHSNAQDEHNPTFVEMVKQCSMYKISLKKRKLTGEYIKLYSDTDEERRELINKLDELQFQYFALKPKAERPIKVVIKGLPRDSKPQNIKKNLVSTYRLNY